MSEGFRGPQVCRLTGLSYRQIDYWDEIGVLKPSIAPAMGSGSQRLYSADDILLGMAIQALLLDGFSLFRIRRELVSQIRDAIKISRDEYRWGTIPVTHRLDLASLREHLHGLV